MTMISITDIKLPTWLSGIDATALAKACRIYWQTIVDYLYWWLDQLQVDSAGITILDCLAWERGVNRLENEDIELYRLRIKHAVANSEDAGSTIGLKRIFSRLGLGNIEVNERLENRDWDEIEIDVFADIFLQRSALISELIKQYGLTCRRYYITVNLGANAEHYKLGAVQILAKIEGQPYVPIIDDMSTVKLRLSTVQLITEIEGQPLYDN